MSTIVNPLNFLRWDDNNNGTQDTTSAIARGYVRDPNRCSLPFVMVHTEAMRFYINAVNGTPFVTSEETCVLDLVNYKTGAVTKANVSPLQIDSFTNPLGDESFNFYGEVVIAAIDAPPGTYYFKIRSADSVTTWLTSNAFKLVSTTNTEILASTSLLRFRHDRYFYGFRYNALTDYTNQIRLYINEVDNQAEGTFETYKEVTTGQRVTYNTALDNIATAECYYTDEDSNKFASIMFAHNTLYINGRLYKAKEAYRGEFQPTTKNYKGSVQLYDQSFATLNRCNP